MEKLPLFAALVLLAPAAHAGLFGPEKFCASQVQEDRASYVSYLRQNSPEEHWSYESSICLAKDESIKGVSVQNRHLFGDDAWHWVDARTFKDHGYAVAKAGKNGPWVVNYLPAQGQPNYAPDIVADGAQEVYLLAQAETNAKRLAASDRAPAGCARHADFVGSDPVHKQVVSVCLADWQSGQIAASVGFQNDTGAWSWLSAEDLYRYNLVLTQAGLVETGKALGQAGNLRLLRFAQELSGSPGYEQLKTIEQVQQARAAVAAKTKKALARPSFN